MFKKNFKFEILICFIAVLALTGCETKSVSVINGEMFSKIVQGESKKPEKLNYEMVKLSNGVVVYKDRSVSKQSVTDLSAVSVTSETREIEFDQNVAGVKKVKMSKN